MSQPDVHSRFLPESNLAELQEFQISGLAAIKPLIREIVAKCAMLSLHSIENPQLYVVSKILEQDDHGLRFDLTTDQERRDAITRPGKCTVVAFLDHVKVQFEINISADDDKELLHCDMPTHVYRIQRRDAYRVPSLVSQSARLVTRDGAGGERIFNIDNLSATGVGFVLSAGQQNPTVGQRYDHARLELGSLTPVPCNLVVRTIVSLAGSASEKSRVGCEFVDLPGEVARKISKFVLDLERSRRRIRG